MRLFLIALAMLCCSVTAHAATFRFITDQFYVDCSQSGSNCDGIEPRPLSVSIAVDDAAFARGQAFSTDVIFFSAFGTELINFAVAGVPGWHFEGNVATYLLNPYFGPQFSFSAIYDNGWSVFVHYASEFSSFRIVNTLGSHESDGLGCYITGSCKVLGHWEAPVPVPEPWSFFLTLAALGLMLTVMRRQVLTGRCSLEG